MMPVDPATNQGMTLEKKTATLLFVDDEPNILNSLQRLFQPLGYRTLTAPSGVDALELLEHEHVDLIMSDMRMPEMDGAALLEQAAKKWPQTTRILLTGYTDLDSAIDAINKGGIYRYIAKPWEDNDIRLTVYEALLKQRLEQQVSIQNAQLRELNADLESKVAEQTREISQMLVQLEIHHQDLKRTFATAVRVFSNLIEMRMSDLSGHSHQVAEHAYSLAKRLGVNSLEAQQVLYAALLHDIGKIGLPDVLINRPYEMLTSKERQLVERHPITGQNALLALEPLQEAAVLIRHHHECYDGRGFPDGLEGENIPFGARILAVANDYDALQRGTLLDKKLTSAEALVYLSQHKGTRYDPRVIDAFIKITEEYTLDTLQKTKEKLLPTKALKPGMILSRDLLNSKGLLLLPRGRELNSTLIDRIQAVESEEMRKFTIHVQH